MGKIFSWADGAGHLEVALGEAAGDHVVLVAARDRGKAVGFLDAGIGHDVDLGAVPLDDQAVESGRQGIAGFRILVDDGHIVAVAGKITGQARTDRSGPENDDEHGSLLA
jgi:hypothetical protein